MATELVSGLGAVALFAVPGYALTELVPEVRRLPLARRAAYGYLFGVSAVAGALYALSHFAGVPLRPPAIWSVVAILCLAGIAAAVVRALRRARTEPLPLADPARPASPEAEEPPWRVIAGRLLEGTAALVAATVCAGLLAEAMSNPVHDWDGRMTWSAQARYLRADGSVDAGVLGNERIYISHPQYPVLLPVAQVAALEAMQGGAESHLQRCLYAAFFPAFLLLLYDGARRSAGRTCAALIVLAASAIPFFAYGEGGAFSTYSDLPLACLYGAATSLLLFPRPSLRSGAAAGLLLAAAVLTKDEGLPLAAFGLLLGWRACSGRRAAWRRFAAAAIPLALALLLLFAWRSGIPNREDENYLHMLTAGNLWPGVVTHVTSFGPVLLRQMYRYHHWSGFWFLPPLLFVVGYRVLRHPLVRRRLLLSAAPLAVGWAAYSIHKDGALLASVTWERLLLQGAIPFFITLAAALAMCWRRLLPPVRG